MRTASLLLVLLVGLVTLAACADPEPAGDGLLAVLDDDHVFVMDHEGNNRVAITDDEAEAADRAFYFQPVWSPDGDKIAFSRISPGTGLHVAATDGADMSAIDTDTLPFYYSWSANGDIALLRNGDSGTINLEITAIDGMEMAGPTMVDSGAPLYFSWSPDGSVMVTHIGTERLEITDGASPMPTGILPGAFQTPDWTEAGIVALERGPGDQTVLLIDPDGASRPLARVLGPTNLVATADGSRLAVQSNVTDIDGVSAASQQLLSVVPNRVVVIDTESGEQMSATEGPALAFFWSPQGDRLLILDVDENQEARWSIWADGEVRPSVSFQLEPTFLRNFLPFFDQYAQSVSLWSPDGTAFAFPGTIDGESGIWVKSNDSDAKRISAGTWVSWSG